MRIQTVTMFTVNLTHCTLVKALHYIAREIPFLSPIFMLIKKE